MAMSPALPGPQEHFTPSRRRVLHHLGLTAATGLWTTSSARRLLAAGEPSPAPSFPKAQIAITLDLEMARNFPRWEDTHWDYQKGNLNDEAKQYTQRACQRVKERGGRIHTFVVAQVFEQENVDWLRQIVAEGHPVGNHTYDHVNMLAKTPEEIQFRFQRAPWLIAGRSVAEVLRENVRLANRAIEQRLGVPANGFRTPGGFADALLGREDVQQMLLDVGFSWISCRYPAHGGIVDLQYADTRPAQEAFDQIVLAQKNAQPFRYPTGLWEIPMSPISDIGAFRNGRWKLKYFLEAIQQGIEWAIEHRGVYDFLAHPSCLGVVDPEFQAIDLICDLVDKSQGRAELVTLDQVAQRLRASTS